MPRVNRNCNRFHCIFVRYLININHGISLPKILCCEAVSCKLAVFFKLIIELLINVSCHHIMSINK
jgi:hypothetical protein